MLRDIFGLEGFDFDTLDLILSDEARLTEALEEVTITFGRDVRMDFLHLIEGSLCIFACREGRGDIGRPRPRVPTVPPLSHAAGCDQEAWVTERRWESYEKHPSSSFHLRECE